MMDINDSQVTDKNLYFSGSPVSRKKKPRFVSINGRKSLNTIPNIKGHIKASKSADYFFRKKSKGEFSNRVRTSQFGRIKPFTTERRRYKSPLLKSRKSIMKSFRKFKNFNDRGKIADEILKLGSVREKLLFLDHIAKLRNPESKEFFNLQIEQNNRTVKKFIARLKEKVKSKHSLSSEKEKNQSHSDDEAHLKEFDKQVLDEKVSVLVKRFKRKLKKGSIIHSKLKNFHKSRTMKRRRHQRVKTDEKMNELKKMFTVKEDKKPKKRKIMSLERRKTLIEKRVKPLLQEWEKMVLKSRIQRAKDRLNSPSLNKVKRALERKRMFQKNTNKKKRREELEKKKKENSKKKFEFRKKELIKSKQPFQLLEIQLENDDINEKEGKDEIEKVKRRNKFKRKTFMVTRKKIKNDSYNIKVIKSCKKLIDPEVERLKQRLSVMEKRKLEQQVKIKKARDSAFDMVFFDRKKNLNLKIKTKEIMNNIKRCQMKRKTISKWSKTFVTG